MYETSALRPLLSLIQLPKLIRSEDGVRMPVGGICEKSAFSFGA